MAELYKKYRPRSLKTIVGQTGAKNSLQKFIENGNIPHAQLYIGPSGCGKTTAARIMRTALDCGDADFMEINSSSERGIDITRQIAKAAQLTPMAGSARLFLLDECHALTKDAQNALLKLLEDPPKAAYFILCTTDPDKVIKTIRTRCTEVKFGLLSADEVDKLLKRVIKREEFNVSEDILAEMNEAAEGSARKALVILEQVGMIEGEEAQLAAIQSVSLDKEEAIKICRTLFAPAPQWSVIAVVLKSLAKEEPEGIRYLVLAFARTVLLGGGKQASKAAEIIDIFSEPFYNSKHAGLAAACWEAHQL